MVVNHIFHLILLYNIIGVFFYIKITQYFQNAISHITDLTVPNHAVLIVYKAHAPMRRGSAHMGAKQDSTGTCATVNAGGVHRAVTGKWGIVANIVQLEDLGNYMKEHATKGV